MVRSGERSEKWCRVVTGVKNGEWGEKGCKSGEKWCNRVKCGETG